MIMQTINEIVYYSSILVMTYITQKYFSMIDSTIFMVGLILMITSFVSIKREE